VKPIVHALLTALIAITVGGLWLGGARAQSPSVNGMPVGLPAALPSSAQPKVDYDGGIVGRFDVTYSTVPGYRPLKLNIFYTPNATAPRPAVIWLHGGGWLAGEPLAGTALTGDRDRLLARMARHGYVMVGLTYRLSGEARFPAAVEDVKAAVRWLRANAASYHIDPRRIAVWGASAGGYLAALTGVTCGVADLEGQGANAGQSSCVQAVIDWFAPIDFQVLLAQPGPNDAVKRFLGCEDQCPAALLQRSNPLNYIKADAPPFLIMHGDADVLVPMEQSRLLWQGLKARGVAARLETVPGANHEWGGLSKPQLDRVYATVQDFLDETFAVKAPR
jgi:acetyl esterase/lipase